MRVVTVGTSEITRTNIKQMRMAGIEVFACVSRDLQRAKNFAEENDVLRYSDDYEKVLASNEFDFVYLGIPNSLHYEYSKKALEANKNVICEKPFCVNQKETRSLVSLALSRHLYIFENMKAYHSLAFKELAKYIELIKPIRTINLNFTKYSTKYDKFKENLDQTVFSLKYACGALMDLNCYNISFVIALFGLPKEVKYYSNKTKGIDTSGTAILKYDGFMATCIAGKDTNAQNYIDISGEKGHIYSTCHSSCLDNFTLTFNNGATKLVDKKEDYPFVPMFKDFKDIYENKNTFKYDQYMKYTFMEMKVLDDLRASDNLVYDND